MYRNKPASYRHILMYTSVNIFIHFITSHVLHLSIMLNNSQTTLPFIHTFLEGSPTSELLVLLSKIMTVRGLVVEQITLTQRNLNECFI